MILNVFLLHFSYFLIKKSKNFVSWYDLASASSLYDSITSSHIIAESSIILAKYFPLSQLHVAGFQIYFFWIRTLFTLLSTFIIISPLIWITFFSHQVYIYIDICFVNVFDWFISVIVLNALRFKSYVLFGTHNLLDKSYRVLKLPTHLSNLTANG